MLHELFKNAFKSITFCTGGFILWTYTRRTCFFRHPPRDKSANVNGDGDGSAADGAADDDAVDDDRAGDDDVDKADVNDGDGSSGGAASRVTRGTRFI